MSYKALRISTGFIICFLLITFKSLAFNSPIDSIGIERQGSKTFILHRVDPKETLFSLSRRYNVKVEQIHAENPELKEGLKEGQVLRILYTPKQATASAQKSTHEKGSKTHVVATGQTLYSISRMYNVSVEDIKKWNNFSSNELSLGQEIIVGKAVPAKVPQQETKPAEQNNTKDNVSAVPNFRYDAKGNKIHITEPGQTLYSIAQIYHTSLDDIKQWNNLTSPEISSGQEIIVQKSKPKEVADTKESTGVEKNSQTVATVDVNNSTPDSSRRTTKPVNNPEPVKQSESSGGMSKVVSRGLAEAIAESEGNPKFLALHKTASVGTIIQVKNELNNLYIFARVIGRLPETSENDKLIIKLSKKAYDKLGAVDRRFPVEVSYVPND